MRVVDRDQLALAVLFAWGSLLVTVFVVAYVATALVAP